MLDQTLKIWYNKITGQAASGTRRGQKEIAWPTFNSMI